MLAGDGLFPGRRIGAPWRGDAIELYCLRFLQAPQTPAVRDLLRRRCSISPFLALSVPAAARYETANGAKGTS
ncbi:hypothetical protein [Mesorhizobium xinjiangense]|uniref:hypothetical protein n=1 Tax=Mesorhizobium xinjiangense TaxID=2678685 RepID=UPI0012ECE457|nr:hypothetical protein [Mesorhizobium xinjiangense]